MRRRDNDFPDNGFEAWGGYMQAKMAKLEEQFDDRTAANRESNLFQGISIYVNGYTKPSASELKMLMLKHGGVYHTYQRSSDYIIASNLPDTKVKRLTTTKIIKPDWITESLAANRVLDYKQFLLYCNHTRTQPRLHFRALTTPKPSEAEDRQCFEQDQTEECKKHKENKENETDYKFEDLNLEFTTRKGETLVSETIPNGHSKSSDSLPPNASSSSEEASIETENKTKHSVQTNNNLTKESKESARTAVDPKFLSEFYSNSRLHHISQLGAGFKQYVNELREASDFAFPARAQFKEMINNLEHPNEVAFGVKHFKGGKVIMHVDMDCFFVSVGLRRRPELRGAPVAVTHATGARTRPQPRPGVDRHTEFNLYRRKKVKSLSKATGISEESLLEEGEVRTRVDGLEDEDDSFSSMSEIASCSYEARAKGIRNGMFVGAALRLCPDLKTIPYDFDDYKEVACTLYNTLAQYTLDLEAVSCDEMYVDCTELVGALGVSAQQLARALRHEVRSKTGCPCSAGFGGNRLQARLATKRAKPDGQFFLTSNLVDTFMTDVKLEELPGVGRQLLQRLAGVCAAVGGAEATCGALRPLALPALQRHLGAANGRLLYNYCRGDDPRPLSFHTVRKSVSAEVNYGIRFENQEQCNTFLRQLCGEVQDRMKKSKVVAKSITVKVMVRSEDAPVETAKFMGHGFCVTINKTTTLPVATDDLQVIIREVLLICKNLKIDPKEMRGVGIQMSKLESSHAQKHSKNAFKAFLLKPTPKLNSEINENITKQNSSNNEHTTKEQSSETKEDTERVILIADNGEVVNSKERKTETVATWVTKTPTKTVITDDAMMIMEKTPVKSFPQRSPTDLKRSPAKSPSKKKWLGLTGRRRGRPPKYASAIATTRPSSKDLMENFLMGDRLQAEVTTTETLDPEFLDALPEDIRREVLDHYHPCVTRKERARRNIQQTESVPLEFKCVQNDTQSERAALKGRDLPHKTQEGGMRRQVFLEPQARVREMVLAWVAARAVPLPCHVDLVSSYLQSMVVSRNIHNLIVLVNFVKRNIGHMQDSSGSSVYSHILEGIQQTMVAVYGKPLLVE